ncbi:hypothetical protein PAEPH01_1225 [Pancytospora epiphaga]|nr:hypothetical protein PAEPH01_1225 [Pancytospora epiphaga]
MNKKMKKIIGITTAALYYHLLFVYLIMKSKPAALTYTTIFIGALSVVALCFTSYRKKYLRVLQWFHRLSVIIQLNVLIELEYPHPYSSRINLLFMMITIGDVVRYSLVARLNENFLSESRLGWYKDVIRLERVLLKAKYGSEYELSDSVLLDLIRRSTRRLNTKAYFCLLCDDAETKELSPLFEALDIIQDNIKQGSINIGYGTEVSTPGPYGTASESNGIYEKIQQDLIGTPQKAHRSRKESLSLETEECIPMNAPSSQIIPNRIGLPLEGQHSGSKGKKLIDLKHLSSQDYKWLVERNDFIKVYKNDRKGCLQIELDAYRGLRRIEKVQLKGTVTLSSLLEGMSTNDANACFRILTQKFENSLSYTDFEGSMRQLNNLRGCLISTLQNNQRTMNILGNTLFAIELVLVSLFLYVILDFGVVVKLIASIFLFISPLLWGVFDSFIFLIVAHPYDIGDRVFIDGENLIVRDIGLTCTIFEKWNNEYVVIANTYIRKRTIKNIRRSKNQQWLITFYVPSNTPKENLDNLKNNLKAYISENPAFEHLSVTFDELKDSIYYRMTFIIKHSINHQNGFFMWKVQNKFMAKLVSECNSNKIEYYLPEIRLS